MRHHYTTHRNISIKREKKKEREWKRETEKESYKIVSHLRIHALQKLVIRCLMVSLKHKSDDHIMEAFRRRLENYVTEQPTSE